MFEHKLCDSKGVAVKKINPNGKSQLRNVRCIRIPAQEEEEEVEEEENKDKKRTKSKYKHYNMSHSVPPVLEQGRGYKKSSPLAGGGVSSSSNRSVASLMSRLGKEDGTKAAARNKTAADSPTLSHESTSPNPKEHDTTTTTTAPIIIKDNVWYHKHTRALTWGTKKKIIPIFQFTSVRKGKTTDRTKRNPCPSNRLLTLVNESDPRHGSLDIEAPTKEDRDKFAKAFSTFLCVPLVEDAVEGGGEDGKNFLDDLESLPSMSSYASSAITGASTMATPHGLEYQLGGDLLPTLTPSPTSSKEDKLFFDGNLHPRHEEFDMLSPVTPKEPKICDFSGLQPDSRGTSAQRKKDKDEDSDVSSLTQGFDQELVEELHQALDELRTELEASRAEAARAVKVAEQAIQSAESCSSTDWNKTVTHKAAEAAAQAQKRSAEAIAKQRAAEERLMAERKSAAFWRKQAQIAEDEVGALHTRVAAAEIDLATKTAALEHDKRKAASYILSLKQDFSKTESIQIESLARKTDQNRLLEIELEGTRSDLNTKEDELKALQEQIVEMKANFSKPSRPSGKKKFFGSRGKKGRGDLLLESPSSSATHLNTTPTKCQNDQSQDQSVHIEQILKLQAEASAMRKQFDLLRRTTREELQLLPENAAEWASQITKALISSQAENSLLKRELAIERSSRRKLLNEVQNLRGTVRVYCLPKPLSQSCSPEESSSSKSLVSVSSQQVGLLHRELVLDDQSSKEKSAGPMTFEFDRMFTPNSPSVDVYSEMEDLVQSAMDGYNSCIMAYGQTNAGKTRSILGDVSFLSSGDEGKASQIEITNRGIQLIAAENLFKIASHRRDRFEDAFSMTIVEVCDEKLFDMAAETEIGETKGKILNIVGKASRGRNPKVAEDESESTTKQRKLEIRTNHDGDIVVQGITSIPVSSYEDVIQVWKESLAARSRRLKDEGIGMKEWEATSHVIATIQVVSTNVVTGGGTIGKLQFVDFAGSDIIPKRNLNNTKDKPTSTENILAPIGNSKEMMFANRSIRNLVDVIDARHKYSRSVPYRNSTLTHLLRDSLEADTKVLLLACVSTNLKDLQETANTMRFAAKMRKVVIGKATKHAITFA